MQHMPAPDLALEWIEGSPGGRSAPVDLPVAVSAQRSPTRVEEGMNGFQLTFYTEHESMVSRSSTAPRVPGMLAHIVGLIC